MIARIAKALNKQDGDKGFTLIELLVVIIIIGILSAIAIPIFLNQRKKAVDSAAQADVKTISEQIATYYVDGTDAITGVDTTDGTYTLEGGDATMTDEQRLVGPSSLKPEQLTSIAVEGTQADDFSVTITYTGGDHATVTYDAKTGISTTDPA